MIVFFEFLVHEKNIPLGPPKPHYIFYLYWKSFNDWNCDIVPSLQMLFVATAAISKRFENGNRVKSIRYCILTSNAFLRPFLLSYRGEIVVLEWDKSDRSQWIPMRYCILYNLIFGGDHQNDAMRPKISFLFSKVFFSKKNMFLNSKIRRMWGILLKLGERKMVP